MSKMWTAVKKAAGFDYENGACAIVHATTLDFPTVTHSVLPSLSFLPSLFYTNKKQTKQKKSKCHSSVCHATTVMPSGNTCMDPPELIFLYLGGEAGRLEISGRGGLLVVCLSRSLFLSWSVRLLCCSLLDTSGRATTHVFKSTRKEVTRCASETGMKGVLSLYGNARRLRVKVTSRACSEGILVTCLTVSEGSTGLPRRQVQVPQGCGLH